MQGRQPIPTAWLISDPRNLDELASLAGALPRGSGIVLRDGWLSAAQRSLLRRKLRRIACSRDLVIVPEGGRGAWRVHDQREIRRARLAGASLLLLSPLFPTRTHPGWLPLPRMRAAALARLAGNPLLALGGMSAARYRTVRQLGFDGWAGIDAFNRRSNPPSQPLRTPPAATMRASRRQ